jgi:hypothetical protein
MHNHVCDFYYLTPTIYVVICRNSCIQLICFDPRFICDSDLKVGLGGDRNIACGQSCSGSFPLSTPLGVQVQNCTPPVTASGDTAQVCLYILP